MDYVAVAGAATGRDGDCRHAFDVAEVGDGEAAVHGLGDGHDFQNVGQLFKCCVLHVVLSF